MIGSLTSAGFDGMTEIITLICGESTVPDFQRYSGFLAMFQNHLCNMYIFLCFSEKITMSSSLTRAKYYFILDTITSLTR